MEIILQAIGLDDLLGVRQKENRGESKTGSPGAPTSGGRETNVCREDTGEWPAFR